MARIQVIGLKSQLMPTVRAIHALGCIQIEDLSEAVDISARPLHLDRETLHKREALTYLIAKIEGLISTLSAAQVGTPKQEAEISQDFDIYEASRAGVDTLIPQVQRLVTRRAKLEAEQSSLPRYETTRRMNQRTFLLVCLSVEPIFGC
jgi:vacuolar-type H+-ATPase subunit I/STV1